MPQPDVVSRFKVGGYLEIKLIAHRSAHRNRNMELTQNYTVDSEVYVLDKNRN